MYNMWLWIINLLNYEQEQRIRTWIFIVLISDKWSLGVLAFVDK